ncbi:MAG TPA: LON peptidase substrate-binding domain-containing protein [Burkholderiaceae bacterium]|nr:LON peptidase substrate-binding domain-containing protein [Burkholderiaceae bacterium]
MRLPIFPLSAVLFPGGVLPLRIFEARYMDMARDCLRDGSSFGVCMISDPKASEASRDPRIAEVGCSASIAAWDMRQLGLLHVRAIGGRRFRVLDSATEGTGLKVAEIQWIGDDTDSPIQPEHSPCVELLRRIIDDLRAQSAERRREAVEDDDVLAQVPFAEPFRMESSSWVSNRLCEVLPVPLKAKQKLMELDDGRTRLEIVHTYLKQHSVFK